MTKDKVVFSHEGRAVPSILTSMDDGMLYHHGLASSPTQDRALYTICTLPQAAARGGRGDHDRSLWPLHLMSLRCFRRQVSFGTRLAIGSEEGRQPARKRRPSAKRGCLGVYQLRRLHCWAHPSKLCLLVERASYVALKHLKGVCGGHTCFTHRQFTLLAVQHGGTFLAIFTGFIFGWDRLNHTFSCGEH